MKIRPAKLSDLSAWAKLRTQLWPDTPDGHIAELQEFFNNESIDIEETLLLEDKEVGVCGFIELNIRNFAEGSRQSKIPYVEGWYVSSEFRNNGYGKQLMAAAENWALQQGFNELASDTEIDNKKSIAIHKQLGFTETDRVVCFLKKLHRS